MAIHKYTQFGRFSVITILPFLAFVTVMFIISVKDDQVAAIILGIVGIIFLICLLIFYRLTIDIDETCVTIKFGTGLFRKKFPLAGIGGCRPVRNSPLYGIGIRMIPDGWLYNVTGRDAIELTFKNKKSVVRIGTDKPEEISRIINRLVNHTTEYRSIADKKDNSGTILISVILFVGIFIPAVVIIHGSREPVLRADSKGLTIKGLYGESLMYPSITVLDSATYLPAIKRRTNGFAAGRILKGHFMLQDGKRVKLFITKDSPPYINIQTAETNIWLNFKDPAKTRSLYDRLKEIK